MQSRNQILLRFTGLYVISIKHPEMQVMTQWGFTATLHYKSRGQREQSLGV